MNFFRLVFPQKISFPDTPFNKNIYLLQYLTTPTLFVDGLIESGSIMTSIWNKGLRSLLPRSFQPQKVLLLGLAGGCNAHLVNHFYPRASITSIEIDPFMIELGNRYFKLGQVKNHRIVIADALEYIDRLDSKTQFDLILVDCFVGKEIPQKLQTPQFLEKLKDHSQYVLINRLWWYQGKIDTLKFFRSISPFHFFIKTHTRTNVVISLV